jgi:thiol:disulfide interchange protein DsbA
VTTHRALAFVAALLAGSWISSGVAQAPGPSAATAVGHWQPGTNYQLLSAPQATTAGSGKVEVDEVFWYGCGHCYALDPTLEGWKAGKAPYVEFVRIPVIWGQVHRQHAKLYYTLQALHRLDLHSKVFDAIHKQGIALASRDDLEARAQQQSFLATQGVSEKDFNAAYDSMTVASNMLRAEDLTKKYAISSVPTMIVNGKYSTSVPEAGGAERLIPLINDLAASEKPR